jgi:hypothetical protein
VFTAVRHTTPWAWPPPVIVLCAWCGAAIGETGRWIVLAAVALTAGAILAYLELRHRK